MTIATEKKTRIFLAEWRPLMQYAYRRMFQDTLDLELVASSRDAHTSVESVLEHKPDLVLTAMFIKDLSGIEFTKRLVQAAPDLPIAVLGIAEEPLYARMALEAGARGYILASREEPDTFLKAVRTILGGERYVTPAMGLSPEEVAANGTRKRGSSMSKVLSSRELMVFHLMGEGSSTHEIADVLHLSPKTVLAHRARIQNKLKIKQSSRLVQQAVQWVYRQGIPTFVMGYGTMETSLQGMMGF